MEQFDYEVLITGQLSTNNYRLDYSGTRRAF